MISKNHKISRVLGDREKKICQFIKKEHKGGRGGERTKIINNHTLIIIGAKEREERGEQFHLTGTSVQCRIARSPSTL